MNVFFPEWQQRILTWQGLLFVWAGLALDAIDVFTGKIGLPIGVAWPLLALLVPAALISVTRPRRAFALVGIGAVIVAAIAFMTGAVSLQAALLGGGVFCVMFTFLMLACDDPNGVFV
jgi:branched-subunit amino acid transport protein